jgi:type IV secretion system coupling TraD/TrwB family protein
MERRETGPLGAFPLRIPVGKLVAFCVAVAFAPLWWTVGQRQSPPLERFYEGAYWSSLKDSYRVSPNGKPLLVQYDLAVLDTDQGESLAAVADAPGELGGKVRVVRRAVNPKLFHAWLRDSVYHGSAVNLYGFFITAEVVTLTLLLLLGANIDRRRRLSAMDGTHRRGTRFISWRRFNAEQVGPLWRLWMFFPYRRLASRKVQAAIRRSRRWAATPECYRAAAGRVAQCLRFVGVRWPGAEGPGLALEIGRLARAVISEELLPYHLNLFGGTGRGKSTLIRNIIQLIRARGETFVVHDPKREFYREFYRPGIDWAIDPRLEECPYWAMEAEAADEPEGTPWASSFFPEHPRSQPFFVRKPRAIFAYLMSRYSAHNEPNEPATCARLGSWLAGGENEILKRVMGTEHYRSLNRGGAEKVEISDQSQGLFSTLGEIAKVLRMMPASAEGRRRFSLREWKKDRQGCIFLCSEPETQEAIMPLHTAIADMAILHTQAEVYDRDVPRVWFVLDEAATMGRIGQLESGMTKQRASGNPIVLGFHDLPQLEQRYGEKGAQTITAQAYTNVIFGTGSEREAAHIEKMIGHEEIDRVTENRPWHLMLFNRGHRARSITNQITTTAPVTAAEIQKLRRFHGYMLQEGRVLHFSLRRPKKKGVLLEPVLRTIPPLIFREEPAAGVSSVDASLVVCPVDDPIPPPWNFDEFRTDVPKEEAVLAGKSH